MNVRRAARLRGALRTLALLGALILSLSFWVRPALALSPPELRGRVNDYANVIPDDAEGRIAQKLEAYERSTGHQYAVLTVPSLEGDPIEDFSIRTVEAWKLGKAKQDDGLLLLVVPNDRKMRIEVGYGLEGDIPDALASRIVRGVMAPAFKSGDYTGGVDRALDLLMKAGGGEAVSLPDAPREASREPGFPVPLLLLFFGLPFLLPFFGVRGRGRRGPGGGFHGGYYGGGFGRMGGSSGGFSGGFSGGGGGFGGGGASGSW